MNRSGNGREDIECVRNAHCLTPHCVGVAHLMKAKEDAGAMSRLVIYFMKNAGEESTTVAHSDGQHLIRSRGLKVYVKDEVIELHEAKWKNHVGLFDTLEAAVKDAISRERGKGS